MNINKFNTEREKTDFLSSTTPTYARGRKNQQKNLNFSQTSTEGQRSRAGFIIYTDLLAKYNS